MKQFFKKIRKRLLERKSVKNIRKKIRKNYLQIKSGKQFLEKICKKNIRKKTYKRILEINARRIFKQKYPLKENKQRYAFIACSEALGIRSVRKTHRQTNFYMVLNNYI